MTYNPFDLVPLLINGQAIDGRPIHLDSDIVDQRKMTNAFGAIVKPSRVVTVCPNCGQGLELEVRLNDPPFPPHRCSCYYCNPGPAPLEDPFVNPVKTGRISRTDLEPMTVKDVTIPESSVAERFAAVVVEPPAPAPKPKRRKRGKIGLPVPLDQSSDIRLDQPAGRAVQIERADGIDEEFDDTSMVVE